MKDVPETHLTPRQRRVFDLAKGAAAQVLQRRIRVYRLVRTGFTKLRENEDAVGKIKADLLVLLRLVRSWAKHEYRAIPWRSLLYAVAALIYFINPIDALPDALVGIGFLDDIAVVTAVVRAIQKDLDRYRNWEITTLPDHSGS